MVEGKTKEEEMKDMETGDTEEGIYSDAGREELMKRKMKSPILMKVS